ncbi:TetR/AcrR family transcriptional regulator [Actinoplanes friuliensis]|jgi:AcrR family transcriptional regulator|uniref:Putative TetR-family transcriptional regulator n=1 Tax=Actinoplanes friuliensis DSM 7358 TaxID=1246995 RepID=U5VYN0_9ACTN|nr:TetR/AcrR family transcriptional regulator [Actinoplanes friuliensis]AGZ41892.1 putative TetR-family transcriptional regulator [Actinoplanes friuliensis DSM 7358]
MPKQVDHQARRTQIADALVRVAAEQGLEAVSLRHVAAAADVSTGMVQHYFRTKDEMMGFAMAVVRERNQERITGRMSRLGPEPGPRELLRTLIAGVLPLDDESRAYGRVALAFLAYTAVRPAAGDPLRKDTEELLGFVTDLIRAGGKASDPAGAAAGLLAVMEGLGVHLLAGHFTPERAIGALDTHLDLLFP